MEFECKKGARWHQGIISGCVYGHNHVGCIWREEDGFTKCKELRIIIE